MRAFLTGSHAYGTPNEHSDVDLAVLIDGDGLTQHRLVTIADSVDDGSREESLKFGKLNLLLFFDEQEFAAWNRATESLKARAPVTREEAVRVIEAEKAKVREESAA